MKILTVYDTYSGGTLDAATFIYNLLTQKGHQIVLKRANEVSLDEFTAPDLIIFGTPSWFVDNIEGKPHTNFVKLMDTLKDLSFKSKKIAIFGLGDETYAHFCGGVDILKKFIEERKGEIIVAPLKLDNYYGNQEECQKKLQNWIEKIKETS